jgi:hypothetical protein
LLGILETPGFDMIFTTPITEDVAATLALEVDGTICLNIVLDLMMGSQSRQAFFQFAFSCSFSGMGFR